MQESTDVINSRMPTELANRVRRAAEAEGRSVSGWVRHYAEILTADDDDSGPKIAPKTPRAEAES